MSLEKILIPDIGGATDVDVIEVLVKPGDQVKEEDSLVSLESDKASMEVPAPMAGTVKEVTMKVGDKVAEGDLVLSLETDAVTAEAPKATEEVVEELPQASSAASVVEVTVPDIGGAEGVDVIDIAVKVGDSVNEEDGLITLESDKASMDVPAPFSGVIKALKVNVGDKVSEGSVIMMMETQSAVAPKQEASPAASAPKPSSSASVPAKPVLTGDVAVLTQAAQASATNSSIHASPAVRRAASEFGINLNLVTPTGDKSRITKEDIQNFVKSKLAGGSGGGFSMPQAPMVDFTKFGDIETVELNKIKRLTGENLSRNWMMIPHVTQFDEADITEMEAFRKQNKAKAEKMGVKLTPLAFIMKAVVSALKQFPSFNASLSPDAQSLILKKYFHVGVAVDTPNGLVVPVVRDVDQKGVYDLGKELVELSKKARDKKLMPNDMQGGCITISSLGGIGGTAFTPIVNAPEVAIVGVSKAQMKPVYQDGEFVPRLMLPLSISYDHRVIDGAEGARFTTYLSSVLSDLRQIIL